MQKNNSQVNTEICQNYASTDLVLNIKITLSHTESSLKTNLQSHELWVCVDALLKSSRKLRERSFSPTREHVATVR